MCCVVVVVCILHLIKFVLAKENENIAECDICYHSAVAASAKERKLSVRIVNENFAEGGSKRVKCENETFDAPRKMNQNVRKNEPNVRRINLNVRKCINLFEKMNQNVRK